MAACVLATIGVVAFWPAEREPEYNGKKLSEWVEVHSKGMELSDAQGAEANKAIRAIGTNALPLLLRWAEFEVPNWLWATAERCKKAGLMAPERFVFLKARKKANAWAAIRTLGTNARPAIPSIGRIALRSPSPEYAIAFLGDCGSDGVPELLRVIEHGKGARRLRAMEILEGVPDMGTNGMALTKAVAKCLEDTDQEVAGHAADLLGVMNIETKVAVPALAQRLHDERVSVRYRASRSLEYLAVRRTGISELRDAVPEFVKAQADPDFTIRDSVTRLLQKIALEVLTNRTTDVSR